jgi:hypothetical protein
MLISLKQFIERRRQPRSRADELATLRARLAVQPGRWRSSAEERAVAEKLRSLKIESARALGKVHSCSVCAQGCESPKGRWLGGRCCGTNTDVPFCSDEMGALKLAGTRDIDLRAPTGDHAGCAFRGETGCSLPPEHRAGICLEYVCAELKEELRGRSDWQYLQWLREAIYASYERFVILRAGQPPRDRSPLTLVTR